METKTNKQVAIEILNQLGGNKFIAMTGAKHFIALNNGLTFRLSGTMTKNHINYIEIKLNSMDLYNIEFKNIRAGKVKTISAFNDIYNDGLKGVIESETGLYLSL